MATVAEPQGESRRKREANPRLQEHDTGSEAGRGRRAGWEQRSPTTTKTRQVEPGGARGKNQHLTWGELRSESSGEVSRGHSSEEGPVMGLEQRAEGPRNGARGAG